MIDILAPLSGLTASLASLGQYFIVDLFRSNNLFTLTKKTMISTPLYPQMHARNEFLMLRT